MVDFEASIPESLAQELEKHRLRLSNNGQPPSAALLAYLGSQTFDESQPGVWYATFSFPLKEFVRLLLCQGASMLENHEEESEASTESMRPDDSSDGAMEISASDEEVQNFADRSRKIPETLDLEAVEKTAKKRKFPDS